MQPKVSCVMLVCGRPEMTSQAILSFESQTYEPKELVRLANNGEQSIGLLRNRANALATGDIICHFDTDDWSHPNRIAEQVALLQSSGADVVGYNEMLFWRYCRGFAQLPGYAFRMGETWIYTHQSPKRPYALGTSLCYWRHVWEQHHFADETQGVEDHWLREKNVVAVSSLAHEWTGCQAGGDPAETGSYEWVRYCKRCGMEDTCEDPLPDCEPRMVACIHSGNTSNGYKLEEYVAQGSTEWRRVVEWDERVQRILNA